MWNALRHPNVLQLLGVTMDTNHFSMVSEWMANGNINEFIKAHRDVNRFELVRFHSMYQQKPSLMIASYSSEMSHGVWHMCMVRQWYMGI